MRLLNRTGLTFALIGLSAGFACGKKSSKKDDAATAPNDINGAVTAATGTLTLSSTLDILPAKLDSEAALSLTEYDDQAAKTKYYLREDSMETITMAKGVICLISDTKYTEQANKGPYTVLLDEGKCFEDESGGDESETANTGAVSYAKATVDITREEGKALVGKMWLKFDGEDEKSITIEFRVAEGSSDSNPLGIFRMSFDQGENGGGYVETFRDEQGRVNLHVVDLGTRPDESWSNVGAARLEIADGQVTSGFFQAEASKSYKDHQGTNYINQGSYKVGFNDSFINRSGKTKEGTADKLKEEDSTVCLDRNRFVKAAHRYNLYDADGALVKLKSGFPIQYTDKDGKVVQGHAGYHGIWTPSGSLAGVSEVKQIDYVEGEPVETAYKLISAPGKLVEYTRAQTTLGAIKGLELNTHGDNGQMLVISWNGTKFVKVATVTHGDNGETRTAATGNYTLGEMDWGYNFHVPSLQAQVFINADAQLNDAFKISYHTQRIVSGTADAPAGNLVCFAECPKMAPTAEEMKNTMGGGGNQSSTPYKLSEGNEMQPTAAENVATALGTYTWDKTTHNLKEGTTAFKLPTMTAGDMAHMNSGVLLPQASWQAITGKENIRPFELDQKIDKFYRFQSGNDPWSQYQALVDSNNKVVKFDAPISISYVHALENDLNGKDDNVFYGKQARLEYGGPGQLWGFPSEMSDRGWYVPQYSLKAGATLGDYTVLPIEIEQVLEEGAEGSCESLSLDDLPALPTDEIASLDIGEEPAADGLAMKYVAGEATGAE